MSNSVINNPVYSSEKKNMMEAVTYMAPDVSCTPSPAPNLGPCYPASTNGYPDPIWYYITQDPALVHEVAKEVIKNAAYAERKQMEVEADRQRAENRAKASIARDQRTVYALCDHNEIALMTRNGMDNDRLGRVPRPHSMKMCVRENDPAEKVLALCFRDEAGAENWYYLHCSNWDHAGIRKMFLLGCGQAFRNTSSGIKRQEYDALLTFLIGMAEENTEVIPVSYGWQGHGTELRRVVRGRDLIWKEVKSKCQSPKC